MWAGFVETVVLQAVVHRGFLITILTGAGTKCRDACLQGRTEINGSISVGGNRTI